VICAQGSSESSQISSTRSITAPAAFKTLSSDLTDACRLAYQSSFDALASYKVRNNVLSALQSDYYDVKVTPVSFERPVISTRTSPALVPLPTHCDGYPRAYIKSWEAIPETTLTTWEQYYTLRPNVFVPFTPYPTFLHNDASLGVLVGAERPTCTIQPVDCPLQWERFRTFLHTWTPDLGELNEAYRFYKPRFEKEMAWLYGNYSFFNASISGSTYLDNLIRGSASSEEEITQFFGGCLEAHKATQRLCYAKAKHFKDEISPLEELSEAELRKLMIESVGCTLRVQHGILHYFPPENRTSRDICANNRWGNSIISSEVASSLVTAVVTAITFPAHKNTRKCP
jgi:hypothetical protein